MLLGRLYASVKGVVPQNADVWQYRVITLTPFSMKALALFILACAVALPASAQTSATVQTETTVRVESSASSSVAATTSTSDTVTGSQGESEKKGNVEYEWKVEEGESATGTPGKPKYEDIKASGAAGGNESGEKGGTEDINIGVDELQGNAVSVSAVEVRGWDPTQKQEFLATVKTHAHVRSEQDLENFAKGVLLGNENMEEISLNFEKITLKHRSSGRLFGFIPISFTQRVELDAEGDDAGRVKVKMPWFSFLMKTDVSAEALEEEAQASVSENLGDNDNWDFGIQAEIIASISNILKTRHEAAMNAVRNMK